MTQHTYAATKARASSSHAQRRAHKDTEPLRGPKSPSARLPGTSAARRRGTATDRASTPGLAVRAVTTAPKATAAATTAPKATAAATTAPGASAAVAGKHARSSTVGARATGDIPECVAKGGAAASQQSAPVAAGTSPTAIAPATRGTAGASQQSAPATTGTGNAGTAAGTDAIAATHAASLDRNSTRRTAARTGHSAIERAASDRTAGPVGCRRLNTTLVVRHTSTRRERREAHGRRRSPRGPPRHRHLRHWARDALHSASCGEDVPQCRQPRHHLAPRVRRAPPQRTQDIVQNGQPAGESRCTSSSRAAVRRRVERGQGCLPLGGARTQIAVADARVE